MSSESSHCQRCSKTALGAPVEVQPDPPPSVPGPPAVQLQPTAVPPPLPPPPPPPPPPPLPPPKLPAAPLLLKRGNGSKALLVRIEMVLLLHSWLGSLGIYLCE